MHADAVNERAMGIEWAAPGCNRDGGFVAGPQVVNERILT